MKIQIFDAVVGSVVHDVSSKRRVFETSGTAHPATKRHSTHSVPTADTILYMCHHTLCNAFLPSDNSSRMLFLVIKQLNAQKSCFIVRFIICLYMYQALCAHHQEVETSYYKTRIFLLLSGFFP